MLVAFVRQHYSEVIALAAASIQSKSFFIDYYVLLPIAWVIIIESFGCG